MIVNLYCIRDKVADDLAPVFQAKNDAVACRMFRNGIPQDGNFNLADFDLVCVGQLDTNKGQVIESGSYIVPMVVTDE